MEVLYQKEEKKVANGNGDDVTISIMISTDLQQDSRKSHQIWRKTDKNSRSGEQIYGRGAQHPLGLYRVNLKMGSIHRLSHKSVMKRDT